MRRALVACTFAFAVVAFCPPVHAQELDKDFYEKNVQPILTQRCAPCHTEKSKGGLRVDSLQSLLAGGDTGSPIVPGDPEKSLLVGALRWTDAQLQMPPKRKLAPAQIDKIVEWIRKAGPKARPAAPTPAPAPATPAPTPAKPEANVAPVTTREAVGGDAKTLMATGLEAEAKPAPEVAVAAYRKLIERFPNDALVPRAYLHLGLCLVKLDKTEEARAALRR
ncbi:MAG TPA: c-type cytochrome domain-containing protein, partial [Planctomycetota bacterium]|nr:c-type cytochrome domain-containing protein [Planctomycetota bacterium]